VPNLSWARWPSKAARGPQFLAGQTELYLVKSLQDYRAGARKNDMMSIVAAALKDQDISDLAAYYAAIPFTVGAPPK
jgi:cytochrome c553